MFLDILNLIFAVMQLAAGIIIMIIGCILLYVLIHEKIKESKRNKYLKSKRPTNVL